MISGNPNYLLDVANFQAGTLTVTPATLTITANNASRVYGAADPTFTPTISGYIGGQVGGVTGDPSFTTTAVSTSPVGNSYQIVPAVGTLVSADYLFKFVTGTLTVTPGALEIKASDTSQEFGTKPILTASYIGLVNDDTSASLTAQPVLATTATESSLPGTYAITVSGARSSNYSITFVGGTYSVLQSTTFSTMEGPILRAATSSPVTFTVDVNSMSDIAVSMTGYVAFYDGNHVFGVAPVVNGVATLTTTALAEGNHLIFAVYQGDNNYTQSTTGTITQMIFSTAPAKKTVLTKKVATRSKKPVAKPKPKVHVVAKTHVGPLAPRGGQA